MAIRNGRARNKHSPGYRRRLVLTHPAHAIVVAGVGAAAVVLPVAALTWGLLLLIEALALASLPYFPKVRQTIDQGLESRKRAKAGAAREGLLARMGEVHRRVLAGPGTVHLLNGLYG